MFKKPTPVVKLLLITNVIVYLLDRMSDGLISNHLAFYNPASEHFQMFQFVTYMFLHSLTSFSHLLYNMISLYFFGMMLEELWGSERFMKYYLLCGMGAGLLYGAVNYIEVKQMEGDYLSFISEPTSNKFNEFINKFGTGFGLRSNSEVISLSKGLQQAYPDENTISAAKVLMVKIYNSTVNIPMVGASGAIYGIFMGAFIFFGEQRVFLLMPPIPIKIKWLVVGLTVFTIYQIKQNAPGDSVAHFAHLGGLIFGYILIVIMRQSWNKLL